MRNKLHIIARTILFCFLVSLLSCEKDLYENTTNANSEKATFDTKIISLKDVPEVESFINNKIGDVVRSSKTGKFTNNPSNITFDIEKIIEVTDTIKNKNYSIRFVFDDTPENVFYNLIINVLSSGEKRSFVEKYTCDISSFSAYKNSKYDFNYFQGTIDLYGANAFFGKSTISSKTTADPCATKFYPNGDPIPSISSFISAGGGSTSGSGGGSTNGGEAPAGGGTSLNVVISGSAPTGSGTSDNGGTGCCSCGNCGTHYYPPTQKGEHKTQKTAVDPCPDIVPVGYIGVSAEPEKLQMIRAELQLTLQQWQWLHGQDVLMDTILDYILPITNPDAKAVAKQVSLSAIDFCMNKTKVEYLFAVEIVNQMKLNPDFATWGVNYMKNNPNVTLKQFENWFMGKSEGIDGDYDAAYWDDPNLTFPQQSLPSANDFKNAYPKNSNGTFEMNYADVYSLVGGTPKGMRDGVLTDTDPLNDHNYDNACALRTSRALNYSGIIIPYIKNQTFKGSDNKYYFLGARNLYKWMVKTFPPNSTNSIVLHQSDGGPNGANFPSLLGSNQGIYILIPKDSSNSGFAASGHAGIYTTPELTHYYFGATGGVESITLWKLN